jgi:FkbM family methyltransferase
MEEIFYKSINWENSDIKNWHIENDKYNFLYKHKLDNTSLVIDIGSYNGNWLKIITDLYDCHGMGLEPVNKFYTESLKHTNDKIKFINSGITTKKNHISKINLNDDSTTIVNSDGDYEISLLNINDFLKSNNFKQIDLLQINIEGYEYELIPHMIENKLFDNISTLQIQFHCISNLSEIKHTNIKTQLSKIGFKTLFDFKHVWYGASKI